MELFIARGRDVAHVSCIYFIKQYRENQRKHGGNEAALVGVGGQNKRKGSSRAGG